jgi:hypothetical protein
MFIREQIGNTYRDFQYEIAMENEYLDIHVWSPISCRFTNWTFQPRKTNNKYKNT